MLIRLLDRTTLRQQITWVAGALCILVVAVTAVGSAILARDQAYRTAERGLESVAHSFADRLEQDIAERFREVRNLAALPPMREVWLGAPEVLRAILHDVQRTLPAYAWIGFVEPSGRISVATRLRLEGEDVSERPWFQRAMQGPVILDVHDARVLARAAGLRGHDDAVFRFLDIAVPVHDASGGVIGVLTAQLSWNWASELRDEVLETRRPELEERITVLDRSGAVILGRELGTQPFGEGRPSGSRVRRGPDGEVLAAFGATHGRGEFRGPEWTVVVERPMRVAMVSANQLTLLLAGLGIGTGLAGIAAFALFARRISRPIGQLTDSLGRIGRDPEATTIGRLHGSLEIIELSAAVRSLLRRTDTARLEARRATETAVAMVRAADERNMRLGDDLRAMQLLAGTDALTGLLNRRAFLPFAEDAMNYFKRYGRTLCVLMVDIDHFKRINDTVGHAMGDEVIRAVGAIIDETIRTTDKVARFGGEEFVVLLREIELADAQTLAERVRERVRLAPIVRGETSVACTVNIGVATARASDIDIEQTIERADRALYAAKSSGRNCVCTEHAPLEPEARQAA